MEVTVRVTMLFSSFHIHSPAHNNESAKSYSTNTHIYPWHIQEFVSVELVGACVQSKIDIQYVHALGKLKIKSA